MYIIPNGWISSQNFPAHSSHRSTWLDVCITTNLKWSNFEVNQINKINFIDTNKNKFDLKSNILVPNIQSED